jgi:hypothetical protein
MDFFLAGVQRMNYFTSVFFVMAALTVCGRGVWTPEQANAWFAAQPYRAGVNYIPAYAINAIEMWSAETFDPKAVDSELSLAASVGFNTIRVFLNDQVYTADPEGFGKRFETFLGVAEKNGFGVMVTFFTNGGHPEGRLGKQPAPNGTHNSGWVKSPCLSLLGDEAKWGTLERYVKGVVSKHAQDSRIVVWDIYNEPGNVRSKHVSQKRELTAEEVKAYQANCLHLVQRSAQWARDCDPSQPITFGVWAGGDIAKMFDQTQIENSDVLSYHCYGPLEQQKKRCEALRKYNRPVLCTEWMARQLGSTFNPTLGYMKENRVWSYSFGLVAGKMETWRPWPALVERETDPAKRAMWFHDIFRADHSPYDPEEIKYIKGVLKK